LKRFLSVLNYHILSNPFIWGSFALLAIIIAIGLWAFVVELRAERAQIAAIAPSSLHELAMRLPDQLVFIEGTISPANPTPIDDYAVYRLSQRRNRLDGVIEEHAPDIWLEVEGRQLKLLGPYTFSSQARSQTYKPATVTENAISIEGLRVGERVIVLGRPSLSADLALRAETLYLGDRDSFLATQSATIGRAQLGAVIASIAALSFVVLTMQTWRRYWQELQAQLAHAEQF
jgi:hypothetical protein